MNENVDKVKISIYKNGKLIAEGTWYNLIDGVASINKSLKDVIKWLKSFEFKSSPVCVLELYVDSDTPETAEFDYLDSIRYFEKWLKDLKKIEPYNVSVYNLYPTNRGAVGQVWKAAKYPVKKLAFEEAIEFIGYKATLYCFVHEIKNLATGECEDTYLLIFGFKGKGNNYYPILAPSIVLRNKDSVDGAYRVLNQLKNRGSEYLTSCLPGCLKEVYQKDRYEEMAKIYLKILSLTPKNDRLIKGCMEEALRGNLQALENFVSICGEDR